MAEAIVLDGAAQSAASDCVSRQQMPLTFMKSGECAHVLKVRGKGDVHHHLENLGFTAGAAIKVVCEQAGNLIVEVKGAQVALDKTAASKIITC
jgi:ferrous iron transport protein A